MECPKSDFAVLQHPLYESLKKETDQYFIDNWPFLFPNEDNNKKSLDKFLKANYPLCASLYFPQSKDERLRFAARMFSVVFIVDDILESLTLKEGKALNERLIAILSQQIAPDPSDRIGTMYHEIWEDARSHNRELADAILPYMFTFMRSQTDQRRTEAMSLGQYLEYRDKDIAQGLVCSAMRYCLNITLTPDQLTKVESTVNLNAGKQILGINDIYSYDKEAKTAIDAPENDESCTLCNGVSILSSETGLATPSAKHVLYRICREWEAQHRHYAHQMVDGNNKNDKSGPLAAYFQGLEFAMSGNEAWSKGTPRYNNLASVST